MCLGVFGSVDFSAAETSHFFAAIPFGLERAKGSQLGTSTISWSKPSALRELTEDTEMRRAQRRLPDVSCYQAMGYPPPV